MGGKNSGKTETMDWTKQQNINMVAALYSLGLNIAECAKKIGIGKRTLERARIKYPALNDAMEAAKVDKKAHAIQSAYIRAFPKEHDKPNDGAMARFLLERHFGLVNPTPQTAIQINGSENEGVPKINVVFVQPKQLNESNNLKLVENNRETIDVDVD